MLRLRYTLAILLCALTFSQAALGKTWSVAIDGPTEPSIQAYIDYASDGDTILVSPGHYGANLNLRGKSIALLSTSGPEQTILDGSPQQEPVIMCVSGEPSSTVIKGFTITGGYGHAYFGNNSTMGGGIFCMHSQPQILDNIITNNRADLPQFGAAWGGGVLVVGSADEAPIIIRGNTITENHASANAGGAWIEAPCLFEDNLVEANSTGGGDGAGLYITGETLAIEIRSNRILENVAGDHGGGAYITNSSAYVHDNLFLRNVASKVSMVPDCAGGAVWLSRFTGILKKNTLAFNRGSSANEIEAGGICIFDAAPNGQIERNIIAFNDGGGINASTFGVSAQNSIMSVRNIIFGNPPQNISSSQYVLIEEDGDLFLDPFFCEEGSLSDGAVSSQSPALSQDFGPIGAFDTPGCGAVNVRKASWGLLKAKY